MKRMFSYCRIRGQPSTALAHFLLKGQWAHLVCFHYKHSESLHLLQRDLKCEQYDNNVDNGNLCWKQRTNKNIAVSRNLSKYQRKAGFIDRDKKKKKEINFKTVYKMQVFIQTCISKHRNIYSYESQEFISTYLCSSVKITIRYKTGSQKIKITFGDCNKYT